MDDFVPLPAAVEEIAARRGVTPTAARKALIATFITRRAVAICDAYWRTATVGGRALKGPAPEESAVPADFWHLDHANLRPSDGAQFVPSGYLGKWGATATFQAEMCLSAEYAADRYPEFPELRHLGGRPVEFQTCAMDVRICPADIDALIERGKTPRQFDAMLKEARRKISIAQGNVSKSDSERLLARLCCNFLTLSHQWELASNPDKVLELVRSTCSRVSEDAAVSDRMMLRIANLIADEAQGLARRRSL